MQAKPVKQKANKGRKPKKTATTIKLSDAVAPGETVLVTTEEEDGTVLVSNIAGELVETEYIVEGESGVKYAACKSTFALLIKCTHHHPFFQLFQVTGLL